MFDNLATLWSHVSWINRILLCYLFIYLLMVHNFGDSRDISRAWETIRENVKITTEECLGHDEWKQHK
jgi:hypothetical protein